MDAENQDKLEPKTLKLAEGLEGRVLRFEMPHRTSKEVHEQAERMRIRRNEALEELRQDKLWDRSAPKTGLQVQIAMEEIRSDKSWDRNAPKGWMQEQALEDEKRERQKQAVSRRKKRATGANKPKLNKPLKKIE